MPVKRNGLKFILAIKESRATHQVQVSGSFHSDGSFYAFSTSFSKLTQLQLSLIMSLSLIIM